MTERVYTVTEITAGIKGLLEEAYPALVVEGELSNFRPAASGHWYFSLKDDDSLIDGVLFRGSQRNVSIAPTDGMMVRVQGSLSVYGKRGRYQIICRTMESAGEGAILAMLADRRRRLAAEGFVDSERKRPLPLFPRSVAVVTSPTGAAIRDILSVLERRDAQVTLRVLPTTVQGESAGASIAAQIRRASAYGLGEVCIVTRGGGSLEDLLPFSDEAVVRAIAESPIPVISAVGHEIDEALSDLAADVRAPTPSAAAQIVSVGSVEVQRRIGDAGREIARTFTARLDSLRARLTRYSVEELQYRFRNFVQPWYQRLDDARTDMRAGGGDITGRLRRRLDVATERISGASPWLILERGYTIVTNREDGTIITGAESTEDGMDITIRWHDGERIGQLHEEHRDDGQL